MIRRVLFTSVLLSTSLLCAHKMTPHNPPSNRIDENQVMEKVTKLDAYAALSIEEMMQKSNEIWNHIGSLTTMLMMRGNAGLGREMKNTVSNHIKSYMEIEREKLAIYRAEKNKLDNQ